MFLHLSISHSVHRGAPHPGGEVRGSGWGGGVSRPTPKGDVKAHTGGVRPGPGLIGGSHHADPPRADGY